MHRWTSEHSKESDAMCYRAVQNGTVKAILCESICTCFQDPADATAKVDGVRSETACIVLCLLFSGQEECTYIHGTTMFSGQEECTYIQGKKREREITMLSTT